MAYSLAEIEAFNKHWVGTKSHQAFYRWYNEVGMKMNGIQGLCHDDLCAGIWRGVEKWINEEKMKLIEQSEKLKLEIDKNENNT